MDNPQRISKKLHEVTKILDKDGISMWSCTTVSHWKIKLQRVNKKHLSENVS